MQKPPRQRAAVRAAVHRPVVLGVRIRSAGRDREVRWVEQDPVEPTESVEQVGPHETDREAFAPGEPREPEKRRPVHVGRDDPGAVPSRVERGQAGPRAEVGERGAGRSSGERQEQIGVFARRVDVRVVRIGRARSSRGRLGVGHRRAGPSIAQSSYPMGAF